MPANSERTWVVGHDLSTCADAAADLALDDISSFGGGRLVLISVVGVMLPPAPIEGIAMGATLVQLEDSMRADAMNGLERVASRLGERLKQRHAGKGPVTIECVARIGTPAETVLEEAQQRGAERVVVGTHGRTGAMHFLLGSVAERIARRAKVPVLIVPGKPAS